MALLEIRQLGDPVLRKKAKRVNRIEGVQRLIDDMIETLRAAPGVGLAAPQVGVPVRVIVIDARDEELLVLINPEIVKREGEREVDEGCLSIAGFRGVLKRSVSVVAKGRDRSGKAVRIRGEELLAQALEHEIDHLDGILYIDRLESPDRLMRLEPEEPSPDETAVAPGSSAPV